ncbi:MAG: aliphatic sulfonate ABC transporter substrate-binding protein, partial [Chroococcidiopsidaceae cyanobacterium CP_BM_ER_R8_30]|nr:aliphatic sulfonate ABC transporter substrate-binding protein [Chroococcidiopsidaceae cyanobacterium CP_BM_ER_R8_30]
SRQHLKRRRLLELGISTAALAACSPLATPPATTPSASSAPQTTPPASQGNTPQLRLGFQPPYVAVFAMRQQRLLEQALTRQQTDVEYHRLLSLNPITEAVAGGALDLGIGGPPILAIASELPIRIVALVERSPKTHALLVRPDSPIKSIADLKGKKLGTPVGRSHLLPLRVLERAGLKDTDVEWIKIENDVGSTALLKGAIDVWATWDPFYANIEAKKEAVALVDGEKYILNYVVVFGRTDYLEKYPETVQQFLKAYKQAVNWVKDNHQGALDLLASATKLAPEVAKLTLDRRTILFAPPNEEFHADMVDQGKLLARLGVIKREPHWERAIDSTLAKAVST